MKNIFKLGLLSMLSLSVVSCEVDEIKDYSTLADIAFMTSLDRGNDSPICLPTDSHMSIMDVSQGALSHKWIVPENEGVFFVKHEPIADKEADIIWKDHIDYTVPYTNSLETLHVYFDENASTADGEPIKIKLVNTYDKPVQYTYTVDDQGNQLETIYSKEVNGVHVFEMEFWVQIYDKIMVPAAKFYTDAAMTQEIEAETQEVVAADGETTQIQTFNVTVGQTVYFKDASTDRPNVWTWGVTPTAATGLKKSTYTTQDIEYTFPAEGTYTVSLGVSRAAEGNAHYSSMIPTGAVKTNAQLVKINVADVPPANPVIKSVLYNPASKNIEVSVDNAMFDEATLETSKFTIAYTNEDKGITTPVEMTAKNVYVKYYDAGGVGDPADFVYTYNTIIVEPSEPLYTNDVITIKYDVYEDGIKYKGGDYTNDVEFDLPATEVKVENELLFSYDFEDKELGSSASWIMREAGKGNSGEVYDAKPKVYSNPNLTDNGSSKCLYINLNKARRTANTTTALLTYDDYNDTFTPNKTEGVQYRVKYKYMYDKGATGAQIASSIGIYNAYNLTTPSKYGAALKTSGLVETSDVNTWKEVDQVVSILSAELPTETATDVYNEFVPYFTFTEGWNCLLYIDDIEATVYYPRP